MSENKSVSKKSKTKSILKILRIIKTVVFAVVLVFLIGVIILSVTTRANGKTPFFFGYSIQRVSSESMVPTLQVGDIILCKQCDPMTLEKGDIITYEGTKGQFKDKLVTHRVIKAPYQDKGEYYLVTKGDDNPVEDTPVRLSDVLGKCEKKLTYLNSLYEFFITPWGLLVILALIVFAFFGDIVTFFKTLLGFGPVEKTNVEEIIERYYKEQQELEAEKKESEIEEKADKLIAEERQPLPDIPALDEDADDSASETPRIDDGEERQEEPGENSDTAPQPSVKSTGAKKKHHKKKKKNKK